MPIIDQINTRVDPALKSELDAIAATLEVPSSTLLREALEGAIPAFRDRADAEMKRKHGFPGNIPAAAIESEATDLLRRIARSEPLAVLPGDLLGPRGKALHTLLSWLFESSDPSPAEKGAREKLHKWLESLDIKASVKASAHTAPPVAAGAPARDGVQSRPIKPYPRRGR